MIIDFIFGDSVITYYRLRMPCIYFFFHLKLALWFQVQRTTIEVNTYQHISIQEDLKISLRCGL